MSEAEEAFIRSTLDRPIVLVGMMGSGKSFLGQLLAKKLACEFIDTDAVVESDAGMSITDIFELYGEERFRQAEKNAVAKALSGEVCVVATGGGALGIPETLALLKEKSWMIWLDVDSQTLWNRVRKNRSRPLLKTENPREQLKTLLEKRRPLYAQAHIHIQIEKEGPDTCLEGIINLLSKTIKTAKFCP
ncbi:MAG: shikimate kinase [Alphaproteobacteria bacterium]|nr:shikimate kinase [Alphaproteobacteria bacterium]